MRRPTKFVAAPDLCAALRAALPGVPVEAADLSPGVWGVEVALLTPTPELVGRSFRGIYSGNRARLVSYGSATVLLEPTDGRSLTRYTVSIEVFACGWEEDLIPR